jgi:hypothetical protein
MPREKSALNILGVSSLMDAWSTNQREPVTRIGNENLTENSSGREAVSWRRKIRDEIGATAEMNR